MNKRVLSDRGSVPGFSLQYEVELAKNHFCISDLVNAIQTSIKNNSIFQIKNEVWVNEEFG
jgi:hypothetical protein